MKIQSIIRTIEDLGSEESIRGFSDPDHIAINSSDVVATYRTNPFLYGANRPAELLGVVDGRIFAGVGFMPIAILADGKEYESSANPNTQVSSDYRKTGFALDILQFALDCPKDNVRLDYYVSESARKAILLHGGVVFNIKQFAIVKKSSLFLARRLHAPAWLKNTLCFLVDAGLLIHRVMLGALIRIGTIGWSISIADNDEDLIRFADYVAEDRHRFKVKEDVSFLRWLLNNDFCAKGIANKHLWKVERFGKFIGYVIMRQDGESRGRIIDWQMPKSTSRYLGMMLLFASMRLLKTSNAVVISLGAEDCQDVSLLMRLLLPLPMQAATLELREDSPLHKHDGWKDPRNWRIRPTMGDSGFY